MIKATKDEQTKLLQVQDIDIERISVLFEVNNSALGKYINVLKEKFFKATENEQKIKHAIRRLKNERESIQAIIEKERGRVKKIDDRLKEDGVTPKEVERLMEEQKSSTKKEKEAGDKLAKSNSEIGKAEEILEKQQDAISKIKEVLKSSIEQYKQEFKDSQDKLETLAEKRAELVDGINTELVALYENLFDASKSEVVIRFVDGKVKSKMRFDLSQGEISKLKSLSNDDVELLDDYGYLVVRV